jgi:hypothetical protein
VNAALRPSKYDVNVRHVHVAVQDARFIRDASALTLLRRSSMETIIGVGEGEGQNIDILLR